ncbi:hypothetical protein BU24DRAFT_57407 [Aaosphaeria arxii CBS 175.79]|uniref:Uncharacterized protein n=1 Tax=Aaosphaeria arxii CBS 175.79 TaxID=1450172 RepID=A0A6A5XBV2_9PLEO|nr:uncharacterized protein BU24DRAFT_57407 [Aaosphaeria arxii CBS 175.79]KAF2010379.1 hypothetical protein BU24DRAFT_57407 [Aaosphaeria arxii CBS 175.79]
MHTQKLRTVHYLDRNPPFDDEDLDPDAKPPTLSIHSRPFKAAIKPHTPGYPCPAFLHRSGASFSWWAFLCFSSLGKRLLGLAACHLRVCRPPFSELQS